jgi:hypothetical protein
MKNPQPGYFQFDWISARHPDLYHRFELSTGAVPGLEAFRLDRCPRSAAGSEGGGTAGPVVALACRSPRAR